MRKIFTKCNIDNLEYKIDPYIGCEHLCYYCYALNFAETDWKKEILINRDIQAQLRTEISYLPRQTIYIGMNADPYQPSENKYFQTRKTLEILMEKNFSASILTKSGLILHDIELLKRMPGSSVGISLAFSEERIRKIFEYNAPSNDDRINILRVCKKNHMNTYCLICPIMPYITDVEELIDMIAPYANSIWLYPLLIESKKSQNWIKLHSILKNEFPDLLKKYIDIFFLNKNQYWIELNKSLKNLSQKKHLNLRINLIRNRTSKHAKIADSWHFRKNSADGWRHHGRVGV